MLLNELLKAIQPVQVTGDSKIEITGVNAIISINTVSDGRR